MVHVLVTLSCMVVVQEGGVVNSGTDSTVSISDSTITGNSATQVSVDLGLWWRNSDCARQLSV